MNESNVVNDRLAPTSLLVGAIGLASCFVVWLVWPDACFRGYLVGYIFCLGILLGCTIIEMIYRLTGGGWGEMIQRPLEAAMATLPLAAVFFLPIIAGMSRLYPWMDASATAGDDRLTRQSLFLNPTGFIVRAIVYLIIWLTVGILLSRWSQRLGRTGELALARRLGMLSGPGVVLFVLADSFAAVDWQMSLEPHWNSTIFPVIFAISQILAGFAFATLAVTILAPHPRVVNPVGKLFLQDLGSLLLTFVIFWAYVSFSQLLITWTGNLPEETQWYIPRSTGGWQGIAGFLALCQFALPFLVLLSRRIKRNYRALGGVAAFILLMHFVDVYWQIIPAFPPSDWAGHWCDTLAAILATCGIGGVLLAAFVGRARMLSLVPLVEPAPLPEETHG